MSAISRAARHVHKHRPAASERAQWKSVLDSARTLASRARGTAFQVPGSPNARDDERRAWVAAAVSDLRRLLRDLTARGFPGEQPASVTFMAEGFLATANGFCVAAPGAARERIAPILEASATFLNDVLEDLRAAEARAGWKRWERDD